MKKENVNGCHKDINLKNIFKNFLMGKGEKKTNFFDNFLYFS